MTPQLALTKNPAIATRFMVVVAGSLLLTLSAKIQVPFFPVPMSMQSFVAIGLGLAFGGSTAIAAVLAYLAQGALGYPVFAGAHAGLSYMAGPTGGYLLGFVLAAAMAGMLRNWAGGTLQRLLVVSALASAAVYLPGLLWLGLFTGYGKALLAAGAVPFLLGDLVKTVLLAAVFTMLAQRVNKPAGIR